MEMVSTRYYVDLDLNGNRILKAAIESVNSLPSDAIKGSLVYYSVDDTIRYYTGSEWKVVATGADTPNASSTVPLMATESGSAGTSNDYARGDHAHPTDTSRVAVSDFNTYKTEVQGKLDEKYNKTDGQLIDATDRSKLDNLASNAETTYAKSADVTTALGGKVDKADGMGLMSDAEKAKIANLAADANATYATKDELSTIPKFAVQPVSSLPTTDISSTTIYLVPNTGSGTNSSDEYIYVNGAWERLGTTDVDLSGYYNKEQVDELIEGVTGVGGGLVGQTEFQQKVGEIEGELAKKAVADDVYTKTQVYTKTETDSAISTAVTPVNNKFANYYTKTEADGLHQTLETEVGKKVAQLDTSDYVAYTRNGGVDGSVKIDPVATAETLAIRKAGGTLAVKEATEDTDAVNLGQMKTELGKKLDSASVKGAVTSILSNNLTANSALVSDASGKVAASSLSAEKLGHLSDVTAPIQGQLNTKAAIERSTISGTGITSVFSVSHTLSAPPVVLLYKDGELVHAAVSTDLNSITISFNTAPASGETFDIVMIG